MSGHTKGPWFVVDGTYTTIPIRSNVGTICMIQRHRKVRTLGIPMSEKEANARLIAAAPELLEALEKFRGHMERDDFATGDNPSDCYELARAAIAKATGVKP